MAEKSAFDLLPTKLLRKKGGSEVEKVEVDLGSNEQVGIYFSAHWCPPCRGFTPVLVAKYNEITGKGKKFEIVFVSSDRNQAAFDEYYDEMPWLAVPYEDRDKKAALSQMYDVKGIPTLVLVDSSGALITKEGRSKITSDEPFPWKKPSTK